MERHSFHAHRIAAALFTLALTVGGNSARAEGYAAFAHPGILNNRAELDFIKAKVKAGAEPWASAYRAMASGKFASLNYKPAPRAVVDCGSYSNPDNGCTEEKNDAVASYTQALMWYISGNSAYAKKAIEILNSWSAVLKSHTNSNAPLQAAWTVSEFPRAAEIIRHTDAGWAQAEVQAFTDMLNNAFLPLLIKGNPTGNGNWELSFIDGMVAIAVFNDDHATFDIAMGLWRKRVPAYFYIASDGPMPMRPSNTTKYDSDAALIKLWYSQTRFIDGLAQETCRDFGHTQYGLAAAVNVAETALHQGVDLYKPEAKRFAAAMEFHAGFLNGDAAPTWLCGGKLDLKKEPTWEIAYNHMHNRMGMELPKTKSLLAKVRPLVPSHHMAWEALTHADLGNTGLDPAGLAPSPKARGRLEAMRAQAYPFYGPRYGTRFWLGRQGE